MSAVFRLDIRTLDKVLFKGDAVSLVVPAELGYLGVLANHAPLAARLKKGRITVRENTGNVKEIDSGQGGFMEVLKNNVTVFLR